MPSKITRIRMALACAAAAAMLLPLFGDTASQAPAAAQRAPAIRTTTRLVQLSVIVTDKNGQPVTDLRREDFILTDKGEPQNLGVFSMESLRALPAVAEPLPPNTYTNRLERHTGVPTSATVVLFDALNTPFRDKTYAKDQVIRFLRKLQREDRVALYALGNRGVSVLHDFTSDPEPLLRALGRYVGREEHQVEASDASSYATGIAEIDAFFQSAMEQQANFYLTDRVLRTVDALVAIANHLARLPGRKNLVWISGAFPVSFGQDSMPSAQNLSPEKGLFTSDIERAARAMADANLAIYPVDARGLMGPFSFSATGKATFRSMMSVRGPIESMTTLAERTGGRAFYNTNDIAGAVRRAIDDSRVTYELGFYPTHSDWNGRWRELKVQVKRSGLQLRYRRGYFALPDRELDQQARQSLLTETAMSPLDATALALTVHTQPGEGMDAGKWKIELRLNPGEVRLSQQEGRWIGAVDVLIVQRSDVGRRVDAFETTVNINLDPQAFEHLQREGLTLSKHIALHPSTEEIRVVARDENSGAMGSLRIPARALQPAAAR